MKLFDLIVKAKDTKEFTIVDTIHDNKTGEEETKIYHSNDRFADNVSWEVQKHEVVMFEAIKKHSIKVWTYGEVN